MPVHKDGLTNTIIAMYPLIKVAGSCLFCKFKKICHTFTLTEDIIYGIEDTDQKIVLLSSCFYFGQKLRERNKNKQNTCILENCEQDSTRRHKVFSPLRFFSYKKLCSRCHSSNKHWHTCKYRNIKSYSSGNGQYG